MPGLRAAIRFWYHLWYDADGVEAVSNVTDMEKARRACRSRQPLRLRSARRPLSDRTAYALLSRKGEVLVIAKYHANPNGDKRQ